MTLKGEIHNLIQLVRDGVTKAQELSERQKQVLYLISMGMSTKEVAHHINLSPKTVEKHRGRITKKLGTSSAAIWARIVHEAQELGRDELLGGADA